MNNRSLKFAYAPMGSSSWRKNIDRPFVGKNPDRPFPYFLTPNRDFYYLTRRPSASVSPAEAIKRARLARNAFVQSRIKGGCQVKPASGRQETTCHLLTGGSDSACLRSVAPTKK